MSYVWSDVRDKAVRSFDEIPNGTTENAVIEVFRDHPALVVATIEGIAERKKLGKVRSGWAVLKAEVQRVSAVEDIVVNDEGERTRALARAETWMRTTGVHLDRESEVEDELFGEHGRMKRWQNDDLIRQKLLALWEKERPRGVAVEEEAENRARHWVETRKQAKISVVQETDDDDDIPF